jgi:hypothetical protein
MMNFVCIKWGDKYEPAYVNNLYRMVQNNYKHDFTFTCFTDDPVGLDCDTQPIPDIDPLHPKYWFGIENYCWDRSKFLVFNSHNWLGYNGKWCYMDLDIIIHNDISDLNELALKPRIAHSNWQDPKQLHDRKFIDIRGTYHNSSLMCWNRDQCEHIFWDVIQEEQQIFRTFFKGTDNYHFWRQREFWNNIPHDWLYSYNHGLKYPDDLERYKYREDCKICIFNVNKIKGQTPQYEINEIDDEQLLRHWHGNTNS